MLKVTVVRKDKGLTQAQLSDLTGIAAPQINALERQRIKPYEGWQRRIAAALEWDREPRELFEDVQV